MAARVLDPQTLIGDHLVGLTVGWRVRGDDRRPIAYLLRFGSGVEARATVTDDGTVQLVVESPPSDFDALELEAVEAASVIAPVVGRTIVGVDRVWWLGGGGIGMRVRVGEEGLVIAADEVHGRYEVSILDGDLGEDWGQEPVA